MVADLNEVKATLDTAETAYKDACQAVSTARSGETAALNNLNKAQKEFDIVVEVIRGRTGKSSDWWNGCYRKEEE